MRCIRASTDPCVRRATTERLNAPHPTQASTHPECVGRQLRRLSAPHTTQASTHPACVQGVPEEFVVAHQSCLHRHRVGGGRAPERSPSCQSCLHRRWVGGGRAPERSRSLSVVPPPTQGQWIHDWRQCLVISLLVLSCSTPCHLLVSRHDDDSSISWRGRNRYRI